MATYISKKHWKNTVPSQIKVVVSATGGDEVSDVDPLDLTGKKLLHETHIHKGAFLTVDGDTPEEKLSAPTRSLVALLKYAGCIHKSDDKEMVKAIQAEAESDAKVAKQARETARGAGSNPDLIKQLIDALTAVAKKPAPAGA